MRSISPKRRAREAEARPVRDDLKEEVGRCEWCGRHNAGLCVHEILRGYGYRLKAIDKRFAVLVLCFVCHELMGGRDWAEQLSILRRSRPKDFNLLAFHTLAGRVKPGNDEVHLWSQRLSFVEVA